MMRLAPRSLFDTPLFTMKVIVAVYFGCSFAILAAYAAPRLAIDGKQKDSNLATPPPEAPIKGLQGCVGPVGPKGDQGPAGWKGDRGPAGSVGPKGDKGHQGPRGNKGVRGDSGKNALNGFDGKKGSRGGQGNPGNDGDRGGCRITETCVSSKTRNNAILTMFGVFQVPKAHLDQKVFQEPQDALEPKESLGTEETMVIVEHQGLVGLMEMTATMVSTL